MYRGSFGSYLSIILERVFKLPFFRYTSGITKYGVNDCLIDILVIHICSVGWYQKGQYSVGTVIVLSITCWLKLLHVKISKESQCRVIPQIKTFIRHLIINTNENRLFSKFLKFTSGRSSQHCLATLNKVIVLYQ